MLENCKSIAERWGGVDEIVQSLLSQRQQLLVQYCGVCAIEDSKKGRSAQRVAKLCEILVDYVSAGHFEVYEQLLQEADAFEENGFDLLARFYPAIERSTEIALRFDEKYSGDHDYRELSRELSVLGEALENRFEAEDKLINNLHTTHKQQVA